MATIEVTESELIAAILAASVPTESNPHGAVTTEQLIRTSRHSHKWILARLKTLKLAGKLGITTVLAETLTGRWQPISAYYLIKDNIRDIKDR